MEFDDWGIENWCKIGEKLEIGVTNWWKLASGWIEIGRNLVENWLDKELAAQIDQNWFQILEIGEKLVENWLQKPEI